MPGSERRPEMYEKIPRCQVEVRPLKSIDEFLSLNLNLKNLKPAILTQQTLIVAK